MSHPYRDLPSDQFWSRAVSNMSPHLIDPVSSSTFKIGPGDRVATIGSCFAQHLSRHLQQSGMNYYVAEPGLHLDPTERSRRNFGVFSARYGNVYTVLQAVQLFDRAFGNWESAEQPWQAGDAVVDPFRPLVQPGGFANEEELLIDRKGHLRAVRSVFQDSEVLVFTLGLTEGWRSAVDGSVFPMAPGVAGGQYDPLRYEFVNFRVDEVTADLRGLVQRFKSVNPTGRILLTVSPVPLIATFEPRHVLVSTVYSKSVLRVAAAEVEMDEDQVHYFPSYELITAPGLSERYYEDDLREVKDLGVAHVMRVFSKHLLAEGNDGGTAPFEMTRNQRLEMASEAAVVCDEEEIERSLAAGR